MNSPVPEPVVSVALPSGADIPALNPVAIPLPAVGSFDLEADAGGRLAARDADHVRPIGSIAKAMTALVVLQAHPLQGAEPGPTLTMTKQDERDLAWTIANNGSYYGVKAGDRLTERDLLYALMLPSANNIAETLGRWVAGSRPAFVARLNQSAAAMGMTKTHFDDASGFSPKTVSTASDLVILGREVVSDPVLSAIVATPRVALSNHTTVWNLDWLLLTQAGWLGIKTGETDQAGACFLFAVRRQPAGAAKTVTIVGAVLGEPLGLGEAFGSAIAGANAAYRGYEELTITAPTLLGAVTTPWQSAGISAVPGPPTIVLLRRGESVHFVTRVASVTAPLASGSKVGTVTAMDGTRQLAAWDVVTDKELPSAPWTWRLLHG